MSDEVRRDLEELVEAYRRAEHGRPAVKILQQIFALFDKARPQPATGMVRPSADLVERKAVLAEFDAAFENRETWHAIRERFRSLPSPSAAPAVVPWKGEREIADVIFDLIIYHDPHAVSYRELARTIARTVIEKGVALNYEAMNVVVSELIAEATRLRQYETITLRPWSKRILAAGLGAASQGDPR